MYVPLFLVLCCLLFFVECVRMQRNLKEEYVDLPCVAWTNRIFDPAHWSKAKKEEFANKYVKLKHKYSPAKKILEWKQNDPNFMDLQKNENFTVLVVIDEMDFDNLEINVTLPKGSRRRNFSDHLICHIVDLPCFIMYDVHMLVNFKAEMLNEAKTHFKLNYFLVTEERTTVNSTNVHKIETGATIYDPDYNPLHSNIPTDRKQCAITYYKASENKSAYHLAELFVTKNYYFDSPLLRYCTYQIAQSSRDKERDPVIIDGWIRNGDRDINERNDNLKTNYFRMSRPHNETRSRPIHNFDLRRPFPIHMDKNSNEHGAGMKFIGTYRAHDNCEKWCRKNRINSSDRIPNPGHATHIVIKLSRLFMLPFKNRVHMPTFNGIPVKTPRDYIVKTLVPATAHVLVFRANSSFCQSEELCISAWAVGSQAEIECRNVPFKLMSSEKDVYVAQIRSQRIWIRVDDPCVRVLVKFERYFKEKTDEFLHLFRFTSDTDACYDNERKKECETQEKFYSFTILIIGMICVTIIVVFGVALGFFIFLANTVRKEAVILEDLTTKRKPDTEDKVDSGLLYGI